MDKIRLLQERKEKIVQAGKEIRADIAKIVDEQSFVELSAFSFSKNEFYDQEVAGEGVVTGFATVDGHPVYIVAQNFSAMRGGLSKANCDKIVKCLDAAEKNSTPVIYLMNTHGVQVGEGVPVLEGMGKLFSKAMQLKECATQYLIVNGEVYGAAAMLAAIANFTFFIEKKSVLAINSPFVLSAKSGENLSADAVGGAKALSGTCIPSFTIEKLEEAREKILAITSIWTEPVIDAELNACIPALNEGCDAQKLLSAFETSIEVGSGYLTDVKTILGRIGGISVAAVVFDSDEGVELNALKIAKIKNFAELAIFCDLPFVVFSNVKGIEATMDVNNSYVLKEIAEYLEIFQQLNTPKISVVYKNAVGLGYSLFASKSIGFDYACAFANAQIALFDGAQGAKIEFAGEKAEEGALRAKYSEENSDPINAAKDGYIDAIIEPQFVKQHLIASLQMLIR
ncbi:MAG: hypothetical protein IJX30_03730 [Clostridia bacterium]|nr:hypothetical protein [Clostridia bacterium]